jgi:predicted transcriptional regulator of viral defense system
MVDDGEIERVGRGLYRLVDFPASENQSLIETARTTPRAAVCLLSALRVHDLTTQLPHAVWLMIGRKDRAPTSASRLQIVRASGAALTEGIMHVLQDGVEIKLTTPAKTVADCFKYRNRVGLDVAIEALRDGLQRKAFTVDEFMDMAQADRVARVARPYLEALV